MKKFYSILSILMLWSAMASADEVQPLYTADATLTYTKASASVWPSSVTTVKVEVYEDNYVIVRSFAGVEGYDMRIDYNKGTFTRVANIINGTEWNAGSGTSVYCQTGLTGDGDCEYLRPYLASNYASISITDENCSMSVYCYSYKKGILTVTDNEDGTHSFKGTGGAWDKYALNWSNPGMKQAELVYTAKGVVSEYDASQYDYIFVGNKVDIEAYDDGSVIVRKYSGVEGYDLRAWIGDDGNVSAIAYIVNGIEGSKLSGGYTGYQATGIENYAYNIYIASDGSSTGSSDPDTRSGKLSFTGYDYDYGTGDSGNKDFYIIWPYTEQVIEAKLLYETTGIATVAEDYEDYATSFLYTNQQSKVEVYDDNTIIVRAFGGVENFDLKVWFDEDEVVTGLASITNGEEGEKATNGYVTIATGNGTATNMFLIGTYEYEGDTYAYAYATSDNTDNSGYLFIPVGTSNYYYVEWPYESTGINNVKGEALNNAPVYNIAGQKVNAAYKGIVIKNGKKVVVK